MFLLYLNLLFLKIDLFPYHLVLLVKGHFHCQCPLERIPMSVNGITTKLSVNMAEKVFLNLCYNSQLRDRSPIRAMKRVLILHRQRFNL